MTSLTELIRKNTVVVLKIIDVDVTERMKGHSQKVLLPSDWT